jgi:hypothetical protein
MKLQESIKVKLSEKGFRKEYYNVSLDDDFVVDFTLYACIEDKKINISVYKMQVFNKDGRYMVLTDREYVDLINEIVNKVNYDD